MTCAEVCTCKADVVAWWQAAKRLVTLHVQEFDAIRVTISVEALAWEGIATATASAIWGSSADVDTSTTWNEPQNSHQLACMLQALAGLHFRR